MSRNRNKKSTVLNQTNSDDSDASDNSDYNENEQILLSKFKRNPKNSDSDGDEAIYDVISDDNSDKSDIALSDIDENHDDLPNLKAWGANKRSYYSTDYVDQDYSGHTGKDALKADFEEEEAQNLQLELAKQLEDDDFIFDTVKKSADEWIDDIETQVKIDTSKLTKRQQIELLEKEAPEFFNLTTDFNEKMMLVNDVLLPAKKIFEAKDILKSEIADFVLLYNDLLLNYCNNIVMYLLLKSQRVKLQFHPIIKRLLQYRKLINEMQVVYDKSVAKQLANLLRNNKISVKLDYVAMETQKHNKISKINNKDVLVAYDERKNTEISADNEFEEKRAITYQMKKNKGLMPLRKKEQRNPRVKHRNKFRKAQIRRKGAIREVRTEINRYDGEISGIKASVTKSIKIK